MSDIERIVYDYIRVHPDQCDAMIATKLRLNREDVLNICQKLKSEGVLKSREIIEKGRFRLDLWTAIEKTSRPDPTNADQRNYFEGLFAND